jgi:hypothetical protein
MKKILLLGFIGLMFLAACAPKEVKDGKYAEIAKCLTQKGVTFYGAYWCSHCAEQKKIFGDDMRYINYVECDPGGANAKPAECAERKVERFPSWLIPGQGLETGLQQPEDLAAKVGCLSASTQETSSANGQTAAPSEPVVPATTTSQTTTTK